MNEARWAALKSAGGMGIFALFVVGAVAGLLALIVKGDKGEEHYRAEAFKAAAGQIAACHERGGTAVLSSTDSYDRCLIPPKGRK